MTQFFQELSSLSPTTLSVIAALSGAIGAILAAIITAVVGKLIVTPFLGARDKQDREVEWRKHAIELTKLDLERKIKTRAAANTNPIRPSILDFLANYRDLQELGTKTTKELYRVIKKNRITTSSLGPAIPESAANHTLKVDGGGSEEAQKACAPSDVPVTIHVSPYQMNKKELRERITQEDTLLGNRSISFLLGNGFLMAALGISEIEFEKYAIGALGVFVSLIWLSIGWQTRHAITALHNLYQNEFPEDEINNAVFSKIMWQKKIIGTIFGPTELMTFWLPIVVLITWLSINLNMHFNLG